MGIPEYQIQLREILDDGSERKLMPINTAYDVLVNEVKTAEELILPGSSPGEPLIESIAYIRKFLYNLSKIAESIRDVSSEIEDNDTNLATSAAVYNVSESVKNLSKLLSDLSDTIDKTAPIEHADTDLKYGGGTETAYGHVKVSDTYEEAIENGDAAHSLAASQKALYEVFFNFTESLKSHANEKASGSEFSHVRLTDTYKTLLEGFDANGGVGASQNAVASLYKDLVDFEDNINETLRNFDKNNVPTDHASTEQTYGIGDYEKFGHVKMSDEYETELEGKDAAGTVASQKALATLYKSLISKIEEGDGGTESIDIADNETAGIVKASEDISVESDGKMVIKAISVEQLENWYYNADVGIPNPEIKEMYEKDITYENDIGLSNEEIEAMYAEDITDIEDVGVSNEEIEAMYAM